ncbi:ornithine carbamoyltransferase [Paenibacillus sp. NEAU-GSW1]|uniref:ornithine carbamoyltransferase n=1 Tax=Paenibacillus sp. NEAU-GSW1 TaxID=2682486 RepID=UPI0012E14B88|nr:ornithine carbamoyltransferase [Paenibacillus sp. NEAU-GSW1]MUT64989.1 ornithine carbamoyltransferase [Paenibacillus sp. NEAU-GSW1]
MQDVVQEELAASLKGRDFLMVGDYTPQEIRYLIDLAIDLKRKQKSGEAYQPLAGKTLGMIFEKSSTRTRVSFEVGIYQLGGQGLFLSGNDLQIGRGEPILDTAQVLSRYLDGIMIRTFAHRNVVELARGATIPVINGLSDLSHPCQAMADYQTILEHKGTFEGVKLAYVGDGNNVVHSLMMGAAKLGVDISIATPEGYEPDASLVQQSKDYAKETGAKIHICRDPKEAVAEADFIYSDVWASMGQEAEQKERELAFADYQVNEALVKYAKQDYKFLHCLPAHRGEEVSEGVIDGKHSIIFDQAENRLHAQKAIMAAIM